MQTLLRSNFRSVCPHQDVTTIPVFETSLQKDEEVLVTNPTTKQSRKVVRKVHYREPIPTEAFTHPNESCEMYTLENIQRSGVTPIEQTNYYRPSFEQVSQEIDSILNMDVTELTETKSE